MSEPTEPKEGVTRTWIAWALACALVVGLGFWLRVAHYHAHYGHPDEAITVEVVGHMRSSGDWDTNWAKAPNLESGLRYDQYNFSSHLLATFGFYRFVKVLPGTLGWRSENGGFWVYRFFSVLLATIAVWQTWRLAERSGGRMVALVAALLAAVATLLVQDAHFSRPEAFVTALTLAAVALSWPREKVSAVAVLGAGAVVGVLVACKVSMLLIGWLPLVPLAAGWRTTPARWWLLLGGLPLAVLAGFAAGVPGAFLHPDVYVSGIKHLMTQYAGLHPPHSHMNGGPVADMIGAYAVATIGWPALGCGAVGVGALAWRRRWAELILIAGPVTLFVGYFATKAVFFERNLSHVLPLFLILVAVGAVALAEWATRGVKLPVAVGVGAILALLVVRPLGGTLPLVQAEFSQARSRRHEVFEAELRARHPGTTWKHTHLLTAGPLDELEAGFKAGGGPVLMRLSDYHDEWTAYHLPLLAARFEVRAVTEAPGSFPDMPVCTLLTYHGPLERYYLVTGPKKP
ncbi:MAG: glycosyltransferase family 39 protein [Verrucomicrobia bacterium]|nr:glycosyltransferase family 39 protein [Verrucomicrobiota bacterium]